MKAEFTESRANQAYGDARPWLVATACPLAGLALRATADQVEEIAGASDERVTVGGFAPSLRAVGTLAELLAAACPQKAQRDTEASRAGVTLYLIGDVVTPVDTILKAALRSRGAP